MMWHSISEKSRATLDHTMIEELQEYLKNRESLFKSQLIGSIHTAIHSPSLADPDTLSIKETLWEVSKRAELANRLSKEERLHLCELINDALWNYVEVLETCANEFFQQIDLIGFEEWNASLYESAIEIKNLIEGRLDVLDTEITNIEQLLQKFPAYKKNIIHFIFDSRPSFLDPRIKKSIVKCKKFLNFYFQKFVEEYRGCSQLRRTAEASKNQFYNFPAFLALDLNIQSKYKKIFFLLKIWELNQKARMLPTNEPVRALRQSGTAEYVEELFHLYFKKIKQLIFEKSRLIKEKPDIQLIEVSSLLAAYINELSVLQVTIDTYRKFLKCNDPQSWGIKLWLTKPENRLCKKLRFGKQACHKLAQLCAEFQSALEKTPHEAENGTRKLITEIRNSLHEMAQPLASREWMKRHAKILLKALDQLNELASQEQVLVDYMGVTLCKALKEDWKYHVLFDLPLFERVYQRHKNIVSPVNEISHTRRLFNLERVLMQLSDWVKTGESVKRQQEVELDIADIKNYLQNFYAEIQQADYRMEKESEEERQKSLATLRESLLEYLYLFANFLYTLPADKPEVQIIRRKLLFVDQFFDAMEEKLQDIYIFQN